MGGRAEGLGGEERQGREGGIGGREGSEGGSEGRTEGGREGDTEVMNVYRANVLQNTKQITYLALAQSTTHSLLKLIQEGATTGRVQIKEMVRHLQTHAECENLTHL